MVTDSKDAIKIGKSKIDMKAKQLEERKLKMTLEARREKEAINSEIKRLFNSKK